jgi:Ca2+-binding RTX toxin-like protein
MFWFRFARPRRSSTTLKRRRLNFEPLEDRRLLSVNVTNSGGAYTIASNSSADDVRVVAPGIGDVNYDGTVNGVDVSVWSSHYLSSGPVGDANYDGTVNGLDNTTIAGHWLQLSQIQIYDGATLNDTVPLLDITSLAINAAGGTIEIDGNFSRPVTVDGGSNATLDINGNPNRGDTVSMTDSSITLFDSTTTVSYMNIENINFALGGTSGSDLLTINGTSGDDSMQAQSDGSTIVFNGLNVNVASVEGLTLNGNDGNDTIDMFYLNSAIALTINGGAGDDLLAGGAGNDAINGGTGNNTLIGWGGNDTLNGGNGNATFLYMPGPASLGTDTLSIDSGGVGTLDFEYLTDGVTVNIGSTSTQSVVSGLLSLNLGTSTTIANVIGGSGNDTITGNSLSNVLDGRDGDDTITAGTGNAVMYGGNGDDTLTGGSGNDLLYGGAGDDTLAGGGGNDTYLFPWSPGDDPLGTDTITEASSAGTDTLDFSNFFPGVYNAPRLSTTGVQTVGTDSSSTPVNILQINLVNASTIENISAPAPQGITALIADSATTPGSINLTAIDPDPDATEVDFYLDSNHDGLLDTGDTLLGTDTDGIDGWSLSVPRSLVTAVDPSFLAVQVNGGTNQLPATLNAQAVPTLPPDTILAGGPGVVLTTPGTNTAQTTGVDGVDSGTVEHSVYVTNSGNPAEAHASDDASYSYTADNGIVYKADAKTDSVSAMAEQISQSNGVSFTGALLANGGGKANLEADGGGENANGNNIGAIENNTQAVWTVSAGSTDATEVTVQVILGAGAGAGGGGSGSSHFENGYTNFSANVHAGEYTIAIVSTDGDTITEVDSPAGTQIIETKNGGVNFGVGLDEYWVLPVGTEILASYSITSSVSIGAEVVPPSDELGVSTAQGADANDFVVSFAAVQFTA